MGELEPRKLRGMKGVNMDFAEKFPGGVWPVMLTPYTEKGAIDEDALAALTEWYVGSGVKGLFAACQSSEIFYLNQKERLKIVEITMEAARGRVPVIASANTSEDIEAQAEKLNAVWDLGVDAAILLSNRLAGPEDPEEVWTENFYRLLDRLNPDIRLGIYECPYPYKRILRSREIQAMVGTGKFHFLKDTCCDIAAIRQKLEQIKGSSIQLFNANTATLLQSLRDGADGYCGVMANFHPELYVWLCEHFMEEAAEKVSNVLTMSALIERQLYPVNAKWHLRNLEMLPVRIESRCQDSSLLTETFRQEIRVMDELIGDTYRTYCI